MTDKQWKPIEGYENYSISTDGQIMNNSTGKIKANIKAKNKEFYRIKLENKTFNVHVLVAKAFLENKENYQYIIHIDGNKLNNNINNLKWVDTIPVQHIITGDKIEQLDSTTNERIKLWTSYNDIFESYSITRDQLDDCINKNAQLCDFKWAKYVDIEGFENYSVSTGGQIMSNVTGKLKIFNKGTNGFYTVSLYKNGKNKLTNVHTLVAKAFLENKEKYALIMHIDGDHFNNNVSNLKRTNFVPIHNIVLKDQIEQIDLETNKPIKLWSSYKDICVQYNITQDQLNNCIKKYEQLCDFKWRKYIDVNQIIEGELWLEIGDYPQYEVSNKGRIRNKDTKTLLKLNTTDYVWVTLGKDSKIVHRLVAFAFITNPDPILKKYVNHIDGDTENNCIENLEWVTHSENMKHAYATGLRSYKHKGTIINQINPNTNEIIKEWNSIKDVSEFLNISPCVTSRIIKQNEEKNGFRWEARIATDLEGEYWKPVKDYEKYLVSNLGRMKDEYDILTITSDVTYKRVRINGDQYQLHRIIAETFIANPYDFPVVNHIDGDKYNNNIDNLEWVTYRDNNIHAIETGLRKSHKSQKINQYSLDGKFIRIYNSIREAERSLNISKSGIIKVLKGISHSSGGFIWKYADLVIINN